MANVKTERPRCTILLGCEHCVYQWRLEICETWFLLFEGEIDPFDHYSNYCALLLKCSIVVLSVTLHVIHHIIEIESMNKWVMPFVKNWK